MNIIVGDIGGTNTRLGFFNTKNNNLTNVTKFLTKDLNIEEQILEMTKNKNVNGISLAVAGPNFDKDIKLTNVNKKITYKKLAKTGLDVLMMNDFEALGHYIKNQGIKKALVIGAGTGLGKVFVTEKIFVSEAGHTDFPFYVGEENIKNFFYKKIKKIPEYEDIVSGKGLTLIKEFHKNKKLTKEEQHPSNTFIKKNQTNTKTIKDFSKFYGRFIKNSFVDFIPQTIFIAGGVARKNPEIIKNEEFKKELNHKLIKKPKIKLIKEEHAELIGAGIAFNNKNI